MAQEASGTVFRGNNPSNIGAVYFDKAPDLLSVHLGNINSFDDAMRRKEAEKRTQAATTGKLLGDLSLDAKKVLDSDVPYFQRKAQELHELEAAALGAGFDATKPGAMQWYSQMRNKYQQVQLEAEASKTHNKIYGEVLGALDTDDKGVYDREKTNERIAKWRSLPLSDRLHLKDAGQMLVRKTPNWGKIVADNLDKQKPSAESTTTTLADGRTAISEMKKFTPVQIEGLADSYLQDDAVMEGVKSDYAQMPQLEQDEINQAATERGISPYAMMLRRFAQDRLGGFESKEYKSPVYDPYTKTYKSTLAKNAAENKVDENNFRDIVEKLERLQKGDTELYGEELISTSPAVEPAPGEGVPGGVNKARFSTTLTGVPLGKRQVVVYLTDDDGNFKLDKSKNKVVEKIIDVEDRILDNKFEDGKAYIKTQKSYVESLFDPDKSAWIPNDEGFLYQVASGTKDPIKATRQIADIKAGKGPKTEQAVPTITTKEQFDALPKGAKFIRNGQTFTKQ